MIKALLFISMVALSALNAGPAAAQSDDPHSFARPQEARVTHLDLDLAADFEARRLAGTATLTFEAQQGATALVLDANGLEIEAVSDADGRALHYTLGEPVAYLGTSLTVALPTSGNKLTVRYRTRPDAGALQWLAPAMTAGGQHPFLFTQGQAIQTRTWVPTQDSPGIRQTYTARITVPAPLTAVMSAEMLTPQGEGGPSGRTFRFRMQEPIPPYLIALAVGDLAFRAVGPRTGVYAEPALIEKAAWEFADMERMLATAEALYGPYRWGRYDVLVAPPSFPFGGMENPRLTFATPTILAGDRSLVSLIAHELAHSWSGNLVTNATWDDIWLNEGFTTYIENRIMEALFGADYAAMLRNLGRQDLLDEMESLGAGSPDTRLRVNLKGRDPDEGLSEVPYNKGAAFLRAIELAVGREPFDAFLKGYFERNAFKPVTTDLFLRELGTHLIRGNRDLAARIAADRWIFEPGLPPNAPDESSTLFAEVEKAASAFAAGGAADAVPSQHWSTHEWLRFLRSLPDTLARAQLDDLERRFRLNDTGNSEIRFAWLKIAIRTRYEPAFPSLEQFLKSQGRRKFVAPLYADLAATPWGNPIARRIYGEARSGYHPMTAGTIDQGLGR